MSEVFAADSVNNLAGTTVVTTAETAAVTGNFVSPPYQNAKAIVSAVVSLQTGTGTTTATIRIRRNPNAENVVVGGPMTLTLSAGGIFTLSAQAADPIPDGRSVQYQATVQQASATGNGSTGAANISVFLISG